MTLELYLFRSFSHFKKSNSIFDKQPKVNQSSNLLKRWTARFEVGNFSNMVDLTKAVEHPCTSEMFDQHNLLITGQTWRKYPDIEGTPKGTMVDLRDMSIKHSIVVDTSHNGLCMVGMAICSKYILYATEYFKMYYGPRDGPGLTLFEGPNIHSGTNVPTSFMIAKDKEHVHYVCNDRRLITVDMNLMKVVENGLGIADAHDVFVLSNQMYVLRSDRTDIISIKENGSVKKWKMVTSIEHKETQSSEVRVVATKWRVYIFLLNTLFVYKNRFGPHIKKPVLAQLKVFQEENQNITCLKTTVFEKCEILALYTKGHGLFIFAHCKDLIHKLFEDTHTFSNHRVFGGQFLSSLKSILIFGETGLLKIAKLNLKDE